MSFFLFIFWFFVKYNIHRYFHSIWADSDEDWLYSLETYLIRSVRMYFKCLYVMCVCVSELFRVVFFIHSSSVNLTSDINHLDEYHLSSFHISFWNFIIKRSILFQFHRIFWIWRVLLRQWLCAKIKTSIWHAVPMDSPSQRLFGDGNCVLSFQIVVFHFCYLWTWLYFFFLHFILEFPQKTQLNRQSSSSKWIKYKMKIGNSAPQSTEWNRKFHWRLSNSAISIFLLSLVVLIKFRSFDHKHFLI